MANTRSRGDSINAVRLRNNDHNAPYFVSTPAEALDKTRLGFLMQQIALNQDVRCSAEQVTTSDIMKPGPICDQPVHGVEKYAASDTAIFRRGISGAIPMTATFPLTPQLEKPTRCQRFTVSPSSRDFP